MIPCDVVIAQAEYSVCPTKERVSKTFCGSAYHVSRAGAAGGPPGRPPPGRPAPPPAAARPGPAAPPARGAAGVARPIAPLHTGWNTPSHIVPAAARAASICRRGCAETRGAGVGTGVAGASCAETAVTDAQAAITSAEKLFTTDSFRLKAEATGLTSELPDSLLSYPTHF